MINNCSETFVTNKVSLVLHQILDFHGNNRKNITQST